MKDSEIKRLGHRTIFLLLSVFSYLYFPFSTMKRSIFEDKSNVRRSYVLTI